MADDEYVAVVDAQTATKALRALIDARRGYLTLLEQMVSPYPLEFQFDQTKRNQMMTLLSRADTIWVLFLVYAESRFADRSAASSARKRREVSLGKHLTRAAIARGMAISESRGATNEPSRRHTVAAARLVEAGLSYGLFEYAPTPDEKQQPIEGTSRLAKLLHALGDHVYWAMQEAIGGGGQGDMQNHRTGVGETGASFLHDAETGLRNRGERVTATDPVMAWIEDMV